MTAATVVAEIEAVLLAGIGNLPEQVILDLHVAAMVQITKTATVVADAAAIFLEMGGNYAEVARLPIAIDGIHDQLHQVAVYL